MNIEIGDSIETVVGGPYKVIDIDDNLVTFQLKSGIGMTILQHVTRLIKDVEMQCEYSGLPSVKAYDK